ncbi:hypothetical protein ABT404_23730, partial [Streptomyces hyaluromycini]
RGDLARLGRPRQHRVLGTRALRDFPNHEIPLLPGTAPPVAPTPAPRGNDPDGRPWPVSRHPAAN